MTEVLPPVFIDRYCATDGVMANPQLFSLEAQYIVEQATTQAAIGESKVLEPIHLFLVQTRLVDVNNFFSAKEINYFVRKCREVINPDFQTNAPWRHSGLDLDPSTINIFVEAYNNTKTHKRRKIRARELFPATMRNLDPSFRHAVLEDLGVNLNEVAEDIIINSPL